ncbi:hypothetical protein B0H19DRAFT_1157136 [Mycena capillaripes]|nr:hypothetical protein B0H19DRAFT_1157136 [Mycena capillaripes]
MLKALLTQKNEESLEQESKLRTEIIKLEKQNETLEQKRAADATRIESLEAERTSLEKSLVKYEGSQGVRPVNKAYEPEEAIMVVDSSDDEPENDNSILPPRPTHARTPSNNQSRLYTP